MLCLLTSTSFIIVFLAFKGRQRIRTLDEPSQSKERKTRKNSSTPSMRVPSSILPSCVLPLFPESDGVRVRCFRWVRVLRPAREPGTRGSNWDFLRGWMREMAGGFWVLRFVVVRHAVRRPEEWTKRIAERNGVRLAIIVWAWFLCFGSRGGICGSSAMSKIIYFLLNFFFFSIFFFKQSMTSL